MNWIKDNLILEGNKVKLLPLEDKHFEAILEAAQYEIIWTYMPVTGMNKEKFQEALRSSILLKEKGEQFPFVVVDKINERIIGSTSFLKINEEHKSLEIGATWYKPDYWGTGYNEECKWLLLNYCFTTLKTIRVQIVATEKNSRSRKAIERIGAKFEGVLRNMVIRNGERRSTAFYSILEEEWPEMKERIGRLIKERQS